MASGSLGEVESFFFSPFQQISLTLGVLVKHVQCADCSRGLCRTVLYAIAETGFDHTTTEDH